MDDTRLAYTSEAGLGDLNPEPASDAAVVAAERVKPIRRPTVKKHQPRTRGTADKLRHVKVRPDVWRKALRLARGDAHRLVVRATDIVTVANSREHAIALKGTTA